jgi:hypothetical protein
VVTSHYTPPPPAIEAAPPDGTVRPLEHNRRRARVDDPPLADKPQECDPERLLDNAAPEPATPRGRTLLGSCVRPAVSRVPPDGGFRLVFGHSTDLIDELLTPALTRARGETTSVFRAGMTDAEVHTELNRRGLADPVAALVQHTTGPATQSTPPR